MAKLTLNYSPKLRWLALAAAGVLALESGCGTPRRGEPVAGPLKIANPQVERGREVFARHCHMCHPGGEGGLGPGLNEKPLPGFAIKMQVRGGLGVMPAFSKEEITPAQLDDLVAYLKALRRKGP